MSIVQVVIEKHETPDTREVIGFYSTDLELSKFAKVLLPDLQDEYAVTDFYDILDEMTPKQILLSTYNAEAGQMFILGDKDGWEISFEQLEVNYHY